MTVSAFAFLTGVESERERRGCGVADEDKGGDEEMEGVEFFSDRSTGSGLGDDSPSCWERNKGVGE